MPAPDRWLVLTVRLDAVPDGRDDLLAEALVTVGGSSVLQEDAGLTTYLPPPEGDVGRYLEGVRERLEMLAGGAVELSWRWQPNEDWELKWRRGLQPRKVSPHLVVRPSWTDWEVAPGEIVIEIDPQMAFGTGEHATTRGCLRLLDSHLRKGDRVLDVGSGSGILAIAAARLGAAAVVAVEYDPDANLNARENITRNGVDSLVELREALADAALLDALGKFDLIVANILSGVIRPLLPAFARSLTPGGRLLVSGILQSESDQVLADASLSGFTLLEEDREDDWWSALLLPPSPGAGTR